MVTRSRDTHCNGYLEGRNSGVARVVRPDGAYDRPSCRPEALVEVVDILPRAIADGRAVLIDELKGGVGGRHVRGRRGRRRADDCSDSVSCKHVQCSVEPRKVVGCPLCRLE